MAVGIYIVIFVIFSFLPIGLNVNPDAPIEDMRSATIGRMMVNFYIVWCTIFFWLTSPDLQLQHKDIGASADKLQQPDVLIKKMASKQLRLFWC